jgi:hypothetical protein
MAHSGSHHGRVPPSVGQWLLLIAGTFVAGCMTIAAFPGNQAGVVDIGVYANITMAVGIGVLLAWTGNAHRLFCAAGLGAVVTVLGWDVQTFTQAEIQGQGGFGVVPLDAIALPVDALGMVVLVSGGAAIGGIGRLLSLRCPCGRWQPRLGSSTP